MSTSKDELRVALTPILDVVRCLDLSNPEAATRVLEENFPVSSLHTLRSLFRAGVMARTLCDREAPAPDGVSAPVRFSRVAKDVEGFSIDAVHMSGPGGAHTHPQGEVDLCFAVPGPDSARFDGRAEGWTVYAPGSWHIPTVSGGEMDIVYFLPRGAILFEDKPS